MIGIVIFLSSLKEVNIILFFFLASITLTIWEFVVWYLLELAFHKRYWNYNHSRFNYKGKICLEASISWGILAILFIYLVHPFIAPKIEMIPKNILTIIVVILYSILFIDLIASVTRYIIKRPNSINS
jgi:uncharacterized membrane protein